MKFRTTLALASTTSLLLAGCARDPAKDAPKATVAPASTATAPAPEATPSAAAATTAAAATASAGTKSEALAIDTTVSKLNWTGSKVTKVHPGGFKTFKGSITLVDGAAEKSKVELEIETDSIFTDSPNLIGHLKSPDFFDVATYPKATFASTAITAGGADGATHTVKGQLTLHGVTKEISFPATISVDAKQVTAKARFSLNRQDFGVKFQYPRADDLIRNDVLVEWEITAKRT